MLLIEVLSPSTRDYDLGRKFEYYRTLSSLKEYLTVAQDEPHVGHYMRQPEDSWLLVESKDLTQTIRFISIPCNVPMAEIYDKVEKTNPNG